VRRNRARSVGKSSVARILFFYRKRAYSKSSTKMVSSTLATAIVPRILDPPSTARAGIGDCRTSVAKVVSVVAKTRGAALLDYGLP